MKTLFLTFHISLLTLVGSSCRNGGVEPPPPPPSGPDTTSHDFIWQIDTLGDASSILNDVFIIDENNIWAVGEMYLRDSSGQIDPLPYNAAVWNGLKWSVRRVTVDFHGNLITPPLQGVFAFSSTDIWLVGSLPIHGDGADWTLYDVRSMPGMDSVSLSKAWGANSTSMYFVGRTGSITFFNGTTWQKLSSGTSLTIQDIWGGTANGQTEVLAVASNPLSGPEKAILQIQANQVMNISDNPIAQPLVGVWFVPSKRYYVVGSGAYWKESLDQVAWRGAPGELSPYFKNSITGADTNDVFIAGAFGDLLHYNGSTWHNYPEMQTNGGFSSVRLLGNIVVIVGNTGNKAIAVIGRREGL